MNLTIDYYLGNFGGVVAEMRDNLSSANFLKALKEIHEFCGRRI